MYYTENFTEFLPGLIYNQFTIRALTLIADGRYSISRPNFMVSLHTLARESAVFVDYVTLFTDKIANHSLQHTAVFYD